MGGKRINRYGFWVLVALCASTMLAYQAQAGEPTGNGDNKPAVSILPKAGEKPITLETEKLDKVGEEIGRQIDGISQRASRNGAMRWGDEEAAYGITWFKLITCLVFLFMVFIAERLLTRWVRSALRKARTNWEPLRLGGISLKPLSRPISLLILFYGTYAALSPLYGHFDRAGGANPVHTVLKKTTEVGGLLAIVWLLYLLFRLGDQYFATVRASGEGPVGSLWSHCRKPFGLLFVLILMRIPLPLIEAMPVLYAPIINILSVSLIGAIAWLAIGALSAAEEHVLSTYRIDCQDNLTARRIQTQVRFIRKILVSVIVVVAVAAMLMLSEKVRQLGTGILTSAGILGIVVGLAAQRSIANLLVGLQIAVTQPIRIDDVVVIENEWGRIEEITSTYVAVQLWDLRRLMVPLTYFIEKPFQNWTRNSAEILGTVYVYTDYRVDVEAVRQELLRLLRQSDLWDGLVWALQVTDAKADVLELRALMSASDASRAWDLRCQIREKLILYMQKNCPSSLPRFRLEMSSAKDEQTTRAQASSAPESLERAS